MYLNQRSEFSDKQAFDTAVKINQNAREMILFFDKTAPREMMLTLCVYIEYISTQKTSCC